MVQNKFYCSPFLFRYFGFFGNFLNMEALYELISYKIRRVYTLEAIQLEKFNM